jgi:hypothetical protein
MVVMVMVVKVMVVIVMVVLVMVVIVMVVMVTVVVEMTVMVMVVEMAIEKRGLMEALQYEECALFCKSILHTITLTSHSHNFSLMGDLYGRQS